ncbi:MAG: permease-like cell division protein FtsX [Lentimicrobiaceae bacterium]|nr:permease-like cell division protein FtsX [Lentimicrobiaceae bacterium]
MVKFKFNEEKYNLRRLKTAYVTTVISITLVLFMLGLLGLIVFHARKLSDYVKENIGFTLIIKDNVREATIIELQKQLDLKQYVKTTEYITREQAAEQLTKELGEDFIGFLGYNPLLPSIDVRLKAEYANNDSISVIEKQILANPYVKEVFYQKSLVDLINKNLNRISVVILGFSIVLLLIAALLINNTIRLSVYAKRFLIKSMMLVGATRYFIRKPFVLKGIFQGLIGACIAIILLFIILLVAIQKLPEVVNFSQLDAYLSIFGSIIVLGVVFSWASTFFAVRKYLRMKTDDLYM